MRRRSSCVSSRTWTTPRQPIASRCPSRPTWSGTATSPTSSRGSFTATAFTGLTSDAVINHFRDLGVTAVELLPVHAHLDDRFLIEKGLTNYWGYNTLNFFAPHVDYASKASPRKSVVEFKSMVRTLHSAGI